MILGEAALDKAQKTLAVLIAATLVTGIVSLAVKGPEEKGPSALPTTTPSETLTPSATFTPSEEPTVAASPTEEPTEEPSEEPTTEPSAKPAKRDQTPELPRSGVGSSVLLGVLLIAGAGAIALGTGWGRRRSLVH